MRLKMFITFFIVVGIVTYLVWAYHVAGLLSVEDKKVESVTPEGGGNYRVTFVLTLKNPTSTAIDVDRITYTAYLEDNYVGEGEKAFFSVQPGTHNYSFHFSFNIKDMPAAVQTLFFEENATLLIKGKITIPAKVFGLFTYTHITVPYSFEEPVGDKNGGGSGIPGVPPTPVILHEPIYVIPDGALLDWTENKDPDFAFYEVHVSETPGFKPSNETLVTTIYDNSTTQYTVRGLVSGHTYYFKIRVYDTENLYSDSNEVSLLIP